MSAKQSKLFGALAEFETPATLYHACELVREAGFGKWDAHTPFPVHGLDRAMGMKRSRLPWLVLVCGLTGTATAFTLQTWVHKIEYPMVISGKPLFALPAYVPILFELSVLFAAFASVFGMLAFNGLPRLEHPLFGSRRFDRASDDRFFISIEATDPKFDAEKTVEFLRGLGATHVELVE